MSRPRLSPDTWLHAGLDALAVSGPGALGAEPLARALGTTKGSFYWHFKDVSTFQDALLKTWQTRALEQVMQVVGQTGEVEHRLRALGKAILSDPVEPKLRIWAQSDLRAAKTLADIDAERLRLLGRMLTTLGLGNPDFARVLQATLIGLPLLDAQSGSTAFETLVDTILALE
ncbi:TetR/AcrR family transcriptional regulator [Sulfitobacter sp. F26204]|uniref:TetR/AcrR family transcriptional regulator n=1 Tax=Sulfitobacter sp. F26204 TaxID=2996014 RepID=UPI00225E26A1|nr:TetR/AcrR family transcriptional regulator [Sulfitobacter sp. F26204]MCX7558658.1 TetR/AcrR family transcriptional regulator [Sulfitobacter sp. F26204]